MYLRPAAARLATLVVRPPAGALNLCAHHYMREPRGNLRLINPTAWRDLISHAAEPASSRKARACAAASHAIDRGNGRRGGRSAEVNFKVKPITDHRPLAPRPLAQCFGAAALLRRNFVWMRVCGLRELQGKAFEQREREESLARCRRRKVEVSIVFALTNAAQMRPSCNQITRIPLNVILYFRILRRGAKAVGKLISSSH